MNYKGKGLLLLAFSRRILGQVEAFLGNDGEGACFFSAPPGGHPRFAGARLFTDPQHTLVCRTLAGSFRFLKEVEDALAQGYALAGYFTYEFGYAFEKRVRPFAPVSGPLAWMGVYAASQALAPGLIRHLLRKRTDDRWPDYWLAPFTPAMDFPTYRRCLRQIQELIAAGDTYQVNFTFPLTSRLTGNDGSLFLDLLRRQPVGYPALLRGGGKSILSLSPELFFQRQGQTMVVRPMKGTAPRSGDRARDEGRCRGLAASLKNRAENVMIVDLLRNDLGRICRTHSIAVDRLFQVEKYRTLFQMTSTISGQLAADVRWTDIFRNIFPSGSVTGAPKIRTMQIIAGMENRPRGVYTGAVGYMLPRQRALFNVSIRTLEVTLPQGLARLGIGSGIVADSKPRSEWAESLAKARFAAAQTREYQLLETFRWEAGKGYSDLPLHLRRLQKSAHWLGLPCGIKDIVRELARCSRRWLGKPARLKIRLLLNRHGGFRVETQTLPETVDGPTPGVAFSPCRVDSRNPFLRHKTTNRELYRREQRQAQARGLADVLFTNERGAVTEGTVTNVFIRRGQLWLTPPVSDGLLPGIERHKRLRQGKLQVVERTLFPKDVRQADEIRLSNAVRGWFAVKLVK
ncbi:aminodeoxychorismate synthase component I [candidate division FCPU426 bacterium]|nr:aminodeoxychorismate synthase component I [candidate division FCPU426 bacterium]